MPKLGTVSDQKLASCHPLLRNVIRMVANQWPILVTCGHRGQAEQDDAFARGTSKIKWPNGNHNQLPSLAVDIQPQGLSKKESQAREELSFLAGMVMMEAAHQGITLRWGGNWDRDYDIVEHEPGQDSWDDMFHFELVL